LFDQLKETLTGERSSILYAESASGSMSEGAVKWQSTGCAALPGTVARRDAETVASPGEVEEELRHLFCRAQQHVKREA